MFENQPGLLRCGLIFLIAVVFASCSDQTDESIVVLAAASLSGAFSDVAEEFESANPGIEVQLSFAGSSTLREQILNGAPADVFASANQANMAEVIEARLASPAITFATNEMVMAVPLDNEGAIQNIADFTRDEFSLGACATAVPCGRFADQVFAQAGIEPALDTREPNVSALVTKIEAGELHGGIVYRTNVLNNDQLASIELPADVNVQTSYPAAVLRNAPNAPAADAFVTFLNSDRGRAILEQHGFGAP